MKKDINILIIVIIIAFNFCSAQKVEWTLSCVDSLEDDYGAGVVIDKAKNIYLCGSAGDFSSAPDSARLEGLLNMYVKKGFIIKLDSNSNYIKHADYPITFSFVPTFYTNNLNRLFVVQKTCCHFDVDVIDTSLNYLFNKEIWFSNLNHLLRSFHASYDNNCYLTGSYDYWDPPHYKTTQFAVTMSSGGSLTYYCLDSLWCTDTWKKEPNGTYYDGSASGVSIYSSPDDFQVGDINFNTDNSYSLIAGYQAPFTGAICSVNYYPGYINSFLARLDNAGNCVWTKNVRYRQAGGVLNGGGFKMDNEGNFYIRWFTNDSLFINNSLITSNSAEYNGYIIKINKYGLIESKFPYYWSNGIFYAIRTWAVDGKNVYLAGDYNVPVDSLSDFYLVNYGAVQADTIGNQDRDMMFMKISLPGNITASICPGDSFYFGGAFHYTAGTYYDTLHLAPGQDSIIVLSLSVNSLPSAAITASGSTSICSGNSITLNATANSNRTYQWKKGGTDIPGATSSNYTASIGGVYKVTVTNTITGCSKTSVPGTVVTVKPRPNSTITPQGPTTFCAGGSVLLNANTGTGLTYQWKKGGADIPAATSDNYTATIGGVYKVREVNSYGCAKLSTGVVVSVPCREEEELNDISGSISIFPNPASEKFIIQSSTGKISQIIITNISGQTILKKDFTNSLHQEAGSIEIDLTNQPQGIYLVQVITGKEVYNQKIIVE